MIRTVGDLKQALEGMSDADTVAIEIELRNPKMTSHLDGELYYYTAVYEIYNSRVEPTGPRLRLHAAADDRWDV